MRLTWQTLIKSSESHSALATASSIIHFLDYSLIMDSFFFVLFSFAFHIQFKYENVKQTRITKIMVFIHMMIIMGNACSIKSHAKLQKAKKKKKQITCTHTQTSTEKAKGEGLITSAHSHAQMFSLAFPTFATTYSQHCLAQREYK